MKPRAFHGEDLEVGPDVERYGAERRDDLREALLEVARLLPPALDREVIVEPVAAHDAVPVAESSMTSSSSA